MDRRNTGRSLLLRFACSLFFVGGAVSLSPLVAQTSSSSGEVTCTATCTNGSCSGNKPYCVCSCGWFGSASCSCTDNTTGSGGGAPPETSPTTDV